MQPYHISVCLTQKMHGFVTDSVCFIGNNPRNQFFLEKAKNYYSMIIKRYQNSNEVTSLIDSNCDYIYISRDRLKYFKILINGIINGIIKKLNFIIKYKLI
jgi:hypothetical protein